MPGNGLMSYHCTLPQGHEVETSDLTDQQPCFAVESDRSARLWRAWAQRQFVRGVAREASSQPGLITCPICHEHSMRLHEDAGRCENPECGAEAEIQHDPASVSDIGERFLPDDGQIAAPAPADPERDADIRAAAQAVAPQHLDDGCLGEHDPAINIHCEKRPAPPEGTVLVDPGPQPLAPEQVPAWVHVADGSPEPTAEQVATMRERREEFLSEQPGVDWVAFFDRDAIGIGTMAPDGLAHEVRTAVDEREAAAGPTKQREGDQILPSGDESIPDDQSLVIADMEARRAVGVERYGQGHRPFNGRNTILDAYEESLDGAVYLRSLLRARAATEGDLVDAIEYSLTQIEQQARYPYEMRSIATLLAARVLDFVTLRIEGAPAVEPGGGVGRISAARQRQIAKGYTPEHDAQHDFGDLLDAAKSLIDDNPDRWPWDGSSYPGRHELSPGDRLAKAGAMIAAAIDAMAESEPEPSTPEPPSLAPIMVFDILSLVEDEFPASLADLPIQTWSSQTRNEVVEWAGAVHLVASDNDDVTIPDLPEVLR